MLREIVSDISGTSMGQEHLTLDRESDAVKCGKQYYAHTSVSSDESTWQPLLEHLENVADIAAGFAQSFGASDWARVAGYLHDAGKACDEFQLRLKGRHPAIDHSIAGAFIADSSSRLQGVGVREGSVLAPLIAGHHIGLQDYYGEHSLCTRLSDYEKGRIPKALVGEELESSLPQANTAVQSTLQELMRSCGDSQHEFLSFAVFTLAHLLFSSLVDADWLDTEHFMSPEESKRRSEAKQALDTLQRLSDRLDDHLKNFTEDTPINQARSEMLREAQQKAGLPSGIFELCMPTGSGKTLTSLSFALRHALSNGQSRVIYAIPFMSIVEQNAQVFRDVLGRTNVVEHVSSYDFGASATVNLRNSSCDIDERSSSLREQNLRERMLAQNWDSPIVVTTNVQLFESIFSNKASRSRKVHNIANSVIVLDEAQSLPDRLLKPTLAMLETLSALANVSVVLCTATQPALNQIWPFHTKPISIVEHQGKRDEIFGGRVQFDYTHLGEQSYALDELAKEMAETPEALCVVSSRRAAGALFVALDEMLSDTESLYHLSALMVPEHRTLTIANIRKRLALGQSCRVISTQLVEAGVDLDFPVVFREITGVDSMLQAAGRCNREGKHMRPGRVVVFDCFEFDAFRPARHNWLGKMRALGIETIKSFSSRGEDPFGPIAVESYFMRRHQTGFLDGKDDEPIFGSITQTDKSTFKAHAVYGHFSYKTIARRYKFFKDDEVSVFVPWGDEGEHLLKLIEGGEFSYELFPLLQRHTVSVQRYLFGLYESVGAIRRISTFPVPILETRDGLLTLYDERRGLMSPKEEELDVLVV